MEKAGSETTQKANPKEDTKCPKETLLSVLDFAPGTDTLTQTIDQVTESQLNFYNQCGFEICDFPSTVQLPEHVPFSFLSIREVMTEIQSSLFQSILSPQSRKTMNQVWLDPSQASPKMLCTLNGLKGESRSIAIAGTVTLTPTANSYPICVAWAQIEA